MAFIVVVDDSLITKPHFRRQFKQLAFLYACMDRIHFEVVNWNAEYSGIGSRLHLIAQVV